MDVLIQMPERNYDRDVDFELKELKKDIKNYLLGFSAGWVLGAFFLLILQKNMSYS